VRGDAGVHDAEIKHRATSFASFDRRTSATT
jgi:hypothetical protein